MEAKDLRLGNVVTINNRSFWPDLAGKPFVVTGITEAHKALFPNSNYSISIFAVTGQRGDFTRSISMIQLSEIVDPVPLTEEWLTRMGFKNHGIKWLLGNFSIVNFGHVFGFNYDDTGVNIKYIHEIQNLFFALKSEELTIKTLTI